MKGRPSKTETIQLANYDRSTSINSVPDCRRMMELLIIMSPIMGIHNCGIKQSEIDQAREADIQRNRRITNQQVQETSTQLFFLNQITRKYELDGNQLNDKTEYPKITQPQMEIEQNQFDQNEQDYSILYERVNLVARALDDKFIIILAEILETYISLQRQGCDDILNQILSQIRSDKIKYKYLLDWQQFKNITKQIQYKLRINDLELFEKKINTKYENKEQSQVRNKHLTNIRKDREQVDVLYGAEPLEYLIRNLVRRFDIILKRQSDPNYRSESDEECDEEQ